MAIAKNTNHLPAKLEDLTKFVLIGREKLNSVRAEIRAINKLGLAKEVREQKRDEAQMLAGALLDAEAKIGEILNKIPKDNPNKRITSGGKSLKAEELGFSNKQVSQFQQLSDNQDIIEQVKAEALENDDLPTRTEVLRKIKEKERDSRIEVEKNARGKSIADIDIRKGDFKKVLADVYDVDLIITDPPYPEEYLDCFSELSKYASEHLKKDGWLVVYSGQYHLPEVIKRLSEHLTYVWTFCLYHVGKKQLVNGVNIMCGWKPVLIFSRGKKKMDYSAYDVLISEAMEKHSHEWQQSESGVSQLIEIFSKSNDLIVDPFSGSGTFLKVAKDMSRKSIGAEIK